MNRLEDALRGALRREEPPAGFAGRVLAAAQGRDQQRAVSRWWFFRQSPRLRWAAAFAAVVLLAGGGIEYRH